MSGTGVEIFPRHMVKGCCASSSVPASNHWASSRKGKGLIAKQVAAAVCWLMCCSCKLAGSSPAQQRRNGSNAKHRLLPKHRLPGEGAYCPYGAGMLSRKLLGVHSPGMWLLQLLCSSLLAPGQPEACRPQAQPAAAALLPTSIRTPEIAHVMRLNIIITLEVTAMLQGEPRRPHMSNCSVDISRSDEWGACSTQLEQETTASCA